MKTPWTIPFLAIVALVAFVIGPRALAADLGPVKQRMAQRLSAIDALKDRGGVGENNRGLLEARGALSGDENRMMAAENSDRSTVYAALAQQTGSSADQVGRARAKQIAQNSKAGVWLQDDGGRWYQK